jgi:peroxiredoxin
MIAAGRTAQTDAESEWLVKWSDGPREEASRLLRPGAAAPDLALFDQEGSVRNLAEFWKDGPALIIFWRHFGCSCGTVRAERLIAEYSSYLNASLTPVIIAQGELERTARYRRDHAIPCPMLCDPDLDAYRSFGVGQWAVEQVLYDAGPEYWPHPRAIGVEFQDERRRQGRVPVDDPWRATAEFVVGANALIRLAYDYQFCEDFPDPRVLTTAARLS